MKNVHFLVPIGLTIALTVCLGELRAQTLLPQHCGVGPESSPASAQKAFKIASMIRIDHYGFNS